VVERWNRTIKERMFKYFTANNTRRYIDIVDRLVQNYNNTIHSSIKMTPVQASEKKNENKVYMALIRMRLIDKTSSISLKSMIRLE